MPNAAAQRPGAARRCHPDREVIPVSHTDADLVIEPLQSHEVATAAQLLARAFAHETHFSRILPDPRRRARTLAAVMGLSVRDAQPFGHVYAARRAGGELAAVAVWLPPGRFPLGPLRSLRATPDIVRLAAHARSGLRPLLRFVSTLRGLHPEEPYWYLVAIGADPGYAGRGAGSAVLRAGTEQADAAGQACWLETQEEPTVGWYQRFGFVIHGPVLDFPEGFRSWQLRRPALRPGQERP
jgi:ribosomal protein S18 acetylase RimI-like enzyme